ncbi:hypothetical protein LIER_27762 [Lithospermum erythrorhizon]|uniref:Uncharacterized protein n=1 Tax=Lithospermum erythrorhizon TaxID=34254 RepID=A0AAV3RJ69_LITER
MIHFTTKFCIQFPTGITPENVEYRNIPLRKSSTRLRTTSNTDVHELLECPVCVNMMYLPYTRHVNLLSHSIFTNHPSITSSFL